MSRRRKCERLDSLAHRLPPLSYYPTPGIRKYYHARSIRDPSKNTEACPHETGIIARTTNSLIKPGSNQCSIVSSVRKAPGLELSETSNMSNNQKYSASGQDEVISSKSTLPVIAMTRPRFKFYALPAEIREMVYDYVLLQSSRGIKLSDDVPALLMALKDHGSEYLYDEAKIAYYSINQFKMRIGEQDVCNVDEKVCKLIRNLILNLP